MVEPVRQPPHAAAGSTTAAADSLHAGTVIDSVRLDGNDQGGIGTLADLLREMSLKCGEAGSASASFRAGDTQFRLDLASGRFETYLKSIKFEHPVRLEDPRTASLAPVSDLYELLRFCTETPDAEVWVTKSTTDDHNFNLQFSMPRGSRFGINLWEACGGRRKGADLMEGLDCSETSYLDVEMQNGEILEVFCRNSGKVDGSNISLELRLEGSNTSDSAYGGPVSKAVRLDSLSDLSKLELATTGAQDIYSRRGAEDVIPNAFYSNREALRALEGVKLEPPIVVGCGKVASLLDLAFFLHDRGFDVASDRDNVKVSVKKEGVFPSGGSGRASHLSDGVRLNRFQRLSRYLGLTDDATETIRAVPGGNLHISLTEDGMDIEFKKS